MLASKQLLPEHEHYALPPRLITESLADKAGVAHRTTHEQKQVAAGIAHFSYGTAVGALYGLLSGREESSPLAEGIGYGLAVWGASYLGFLPAAGLLSPATEHPARRNALMIAAHVVWGAALGRAFARLHRPERKG